MQKLPAALHLMEIDARQDDVLRQLDQLERRVERALAEFSPGEQKIGLTIFRPCEDEDPE